MIISLLRCSYGNFVGNEDIIRLMIDTYPESLLRPCTHKMLPIHCMLEQYHHATEILEPLLQYMIERAPESLLHKGFDSYLPIQIMARHLNDLRDWKLNDCVYNRLVIKTRLNHEKKFRWVIKLMLMAGNKCPGIFHGGLFHVDEYNEDYKETTCSILLECHLMEEIVDLFSSVIDEPSLLLHDSFYEMLPTEDIMLEIMKACELTLTEFDNVGDTVLHKAIRFMKIIH